MIPNSGYVGYSMSKRAAEAYDNGERPLSKWTKTAIIEDLKGKGADTSYVETFTLARMKKSLLVVSSWHHTSKMLNKTQFYETIDADTVADFTKERDEKDKNENDAKMDSLDSFVSLHGGLGGFGEAGVSYNYVVVAKDGEHMSIWPLQLKDVMKHFEKGKIAK